MNRFYRLEAMTALLASAPSDAELEDVASARDWVARAVQELSEHGEPEASAVGLYEAELLLLAWGPLAHDVHGKRLPHRERLARAGELLRGAYEATHRCKRRLEAKCRRIEGLVELSIRAAASQNVLAAQGASPRDRWLTETLNRLTKAPLSAPLMQRAVLSLNGPLKLSSVLSRVFERSFGV